MARTKVTVDAVDSLRAKDTSLLNKNRCMCPVPPQRVLKGLNTSFAAAILRDPPETKQTERKEGRFRCFHRLTSFLGIRNPPTLPTPIPSPCPPAHPTSTPSSYVATSSKTISGLPAHDTAQRDYEMTTLSPKQWALTPERMRSQDSTSSQRHRDDRDYPPPSSGSNPHYQEVRSHPFRSRGGLPPQLHRSMSMDTQAPRSHSSSRMTRTASTVLPGHGSQLIGTQFESGQASGTGQMPAERQERRPRFPSALQSLLSNDFRCVVRCRAVSHNNCCTIIHRFRILVVGKVCIMCPTGRRRN
jgi:hypothetical protein